MRNRQRLGFLGIAFLVSALSPIGAQEAERDVIGQPLTPWSEGVLDIHHISTGKGNATFVIFPDIGLGAGSTLFWVDPERDLTFVCLTAGVIEDSDNIMRFQKLSDMVVAAVVE